MIFRAYIALILIAQRRERPADAWDQSRNFHPDHGDASFSAARRAVADYVGFYY